MTDALTVFGLVFFLLTNIGGMYFGFRIYRLSGGAKEWTYVTGTYTVMTFMFWFFVLIATLTLSDIESSVFAPFFLVFLVVTGTLQLWSAYYLYRLVSRTLLGGERPSQ